MLDRQVTDDEIKLMRRVIHRDEHEPYDSIQAIEAGRQAGLHEERTRQIVRTWANDGIVQTLGRGANTLQLTALGRKVVKEMDS